PELGSLVRLQEARDGKILIIIEEGQWTHGCDKYAWGISTYPKLPWNDQTVIDSSVGVSTNVEEADGNQIVWTYFPSITASTEELDGIRKGDPIITIKSNQGSNICTYGLDTSLLQISIATVI